MNKIRTKLRKVRQNVAQVPRAMAQTGQMFDMMKSGKMNSRGIKDMQNMGLKESLLDIMRRVKNINWGEMKKPWTNMK